MWNIGMEYVTYWYQFFTRCEELELEFKWIKLLQTPHPLGFNNNIYHEGNISRLPDFDVFSLLDIRKRNNRSHGKRKNGNLKRKNKHVLTLSELSIILKHSGRHMALLRLVTLSISSLRNLDIEANKFYDRAHRLYDAEILTRCYTQHALRPYIDSERTCNGLVVFWPTMDLAEIWIYGGLSFALSHEHVFELTTAYAVTWIKVSH